MLSRGLSFFKTSRPAKQGEQFNRDGGPRSFHKFTYQMSSIILIGETHDPIPDELGSEYSSIFADYVNQHPQAALILEWYKGKVEKRSYDGTSFINQVKDLSCKNINEIRYADQRLLGAGFLEMLPFLAELIHTSNEITRKYENINQHRKIEQAHPDVREFKVATEKLARKYKKTQPMIFRFSDMHEYLKSQIDILTTLDKKYSHENIQLGKYLQCCLSNVKLALAMSVTLETKYRLIFKNDEEIIDRSMVDISIDLACIDRKFLIPEELSEIYRLYATYFFDGTIACELWELLRNSNNDQKNLIIIAGDIHIDNLVSFFSALCPNDISVASKREGIYRVGEMISPNTLKELLQGNYEHVNTSSCMLM